MSMSNQCEYNTNSKETSAIRMVVMVSFQILSIFDGSGKLLLSPKSPELLFILDLYANGKCLSEIFQNQNDITLKGSEHIAIWNKGSDEIEVHYTSNKYSIDDGRISIHNVSEEDSGVYLGLHILSCMKLPLAGIYQETCPVTVEIQKLKLVGVHFENREETPSRETQSENFFQLWTSESDEGTTCIVLVTETPSESSSFFRKNHQDDNGNSRLIFILKCTALLSNDFTFLWNTAKAKPLLRSIELFLTEKKHSVEEYKNVASNLVPCFIYESTSSYFKLLSDDARLETLWTLFNSCRSPMEVMNYIADQRLSTLAKKYFRLEGYSQHVDETYILLPPSVANIYLKSFEDNIFKTIENPWESNDTFDQRTCTELECFLHYALNRDLPTSETVFEYIRTSGYVKETKEECIIVPAEYNEKVIEKMDVDIIVNKTFKDVSIHEAVVKLLRIPEEVIGWNDERKQRYIEELKKGKSRIHRARVIVVGCAGAGKTTLVERLKHPDKDEMPRTTTTVGLDVHRNVFLVEGGKLILMGDAASLSYSRTRDKMITVMDFAGQSAYYACHQVYLTKRAIYVLVTDMSKSMEEKVGQHVCDADGTIFANWKYGDYISFWLQSIRTYCGEEMPVVLVATHKDKLQEKLDKSFYEEILHSLPKKQNLKKHLSTERYFEIEAAPRDNDKILKIQDLLIDLLTSKKEENSYSHWGEFIPSFWLTVEGELEQNREKVMRVSQMKDRFNLEFSENIDRFPDKVRHRWFQLKVRLGVEVSKDIKKIRDMLQFFHEIGYILFFNEKPLNNVAILDVQWFIDAFKSLTMDKNQADVANASNNSNKKIPALEDCFQTTEDMDEFYQSGKLPCETLKKFWRSHEDKDLNENSDSILKYMERLGLLAIGKIFHYIPCVNKMDINISQLERISARQHKTPVLHFRFKHCLHHFFFQRVVVACMHKWKYLKIDDRIQLFKNIVLLEHKQSGNIIAIGVNKTAIQLLVYSSSTTLHPADTYKVRKTVEKILNSVVQTFHKAVNYEVGFSCMEDAKVTQESEGRFILEKDALEKREEEGNCDYHYETHRVNWSKMVKYWKKDQGQRLWCVSRETRNSTAEGFSREGKNDDIETGINIEMQEQVVIDIDTRLSENENINMTDEELKKHCWRIFEKLMKVSRDAFQIYFDEKISPYDLQQLSTMEDEMKKSPCKFKREQMMILFPGDGSCPSSSKFDITIMYRLLRNYGNDVPIPSQGWGKTPEFKDIKETDDLERIRIRRNMLSHEGSDSSMERDVFKMYWVEISQAIKRLSKGKLQAELDDLQKEAGAGIMV
ncbi:uncharacterized protein LOC134255623 [Saccostrea cucullata]|uniref:uncharacterized protein LOC134255623 n=1 Tax=Saccostrea cuccullata TaxID=36930 RepID=UPI002ED2E993